MNATYNEVDRQRELEWESREKKYVPALNSTQCSPRKVKELTDFVEWERRLKEREDKIGLGFVTGSAHVSERLLKVMAFELGYKNSKWNVVSKLLERTKGDGKKNENISF